MAVDDQASAFGVRFSEAIDFLHSKLPEASLAWDSLAGPVHAKVFTVAGATSADLAADLQQSLVAALADGSTITQFRKDFDRVVQEHGWAYNGKRGWRTSIIFDTNMRTAHMAGRWAQIEANKARRPFLQYRTAGDARVRPQHRRWNGLIYPVDDGFWSTHYPPNGWNCRCTVRSYAQDDLDDKQLQVSPPYEGKMRDVTRQGEVVDRVPVGIDAGWDHNVGQSWVAPELALGAKLARLPRELQGPMVDKTLSPAFQEALAERWNAFRTGAEAPAASAQDLAHVVGYLDSGVLGGLARAVPDLLLESTAVGVFGSTPLDAWPTAWVETLPQALRNYRVVLWDRDAQALVVVPQGNFGNDGSVPTITLRPNQATPFGPALSISSVGSAVPNSFVTGRYRLLIGKL